MASLRSVYFRAVLLASWLALVALAGGHAPASVARTGYAFGAAP
jgi:hypothetical protein